MGEEKNIFSTLVHFIYVRFLNKPTSNCVPFAFVWTEGQKCMTMKMKNEKENVLAFGYIGKVTCIKCSSMISKSECLFSSGMPDFHTNA